MVKTLWTARLAKLKLAIFLVLGASFKAQELEAKFVFCEAIKLSSSPGTEQKATANSVPILFEYRSKTLMP